MAVDPNRVREVFLAATVLPPDRRPDYLAETCGADGELRAEVDRLLATHADPGSLLESATADFGARDLETLHLREMATGGGGPDRTTGFYVHPDPTTTGPASASPAARPARSPAGEGIGTVIAGRYALVEIIGEGGMGSVYLASQTEPIKRQVALKLIKRGMDSRDVLARFDAERQALALMDHPNIARIYDGGVTPAGQPFFVMELVKGIPFTEYCDQKRLSVEARLELFVAVCQAVQHAHQKGIIHRDLKPGNVLVTEIDGRPTPKVIDFGVAKATEVRLTDLSFADTGAIVGTPAYMSPEQADPSSMDIDTRTDVYALGVILYELLVGSPPLEAKDFKRGAVLEMLRMVREVDPPRPSTKLSTAEALPNIAANRSIEPARLSRLLQGELDWVVMKALEKDRTRRYDSASGLARDLQRYLSNETVEARPPSPGYRIKKFIRRHRVQVIASCLLAASLIAGIIGTTIGLFQATEQRALAEDRLSKLITANALTEKAKTIAESEQVRATQNFTTARTVILDLGQRISQIETGQANPRLADQARKQALEKAIEQFNRFRADLPDDEQVQMQTARLHRFAATVSRVLGDHAATESAHKAAIQILEDLSRRFANNTGYARELALALADRALNEKRQGKLKESTATIERAFKILDDLPHSPKPVPFHPTLALGSVELDRSAIAYARGQFADCARFAGHSRVIFDERKKAPPEERIAIEPILASIAMSRVGLSLQELGNATEAMVIHDEAAALTGSLVGPNASRDFLFADIQTRLWRAWTALDLPERRSGAAEEMVVVIQNLEKLVQENPQVPRYREAWATAYVCRGELLTRLGKPDEAIAELTKAMPISRELLDRFGDVPDSILVRGQSYLALGRARKAANKPVEAAAALKSATNVFTVGLKADPDNYHQKRGLEAALNEASPPR